MPGRDGGALVGAGTWRWVFPQAADRGQNLSVSSAATSEAGDGGDLVPRAGGSRIVHLQGFWLRHGQTHGADASVWKDARPKPRGEGGEAQDSIFSFFLPFFRKDGVRNFFFFLEGDLEGEPSGETGVLVTVSLFSLGASCSGLAGVLVWSPPLLSSVLCSSSFPLTTAGGSFSAEESAGAWPSSTFLSP